MSMLHADGVPHMSSPNASPKQRALRETHVDIDVLVNAHGDAKSALQAALEDRHVLHNQNAQLWKLVEKLRAQCTQLRDDSSRLRTDIERANTRLMSAGLEPVVSVNRRVPHSSSSSSLHSQSEAPLLRRHLSEQQDVSAPPLDRLGYPLADDEPSHGSRMAVPPEVATFMHLADEDDGAVLTSATSPVAPSTRTPAPLVTTMPGALLTTIPTLLAPFPASPPRCSAAPLPTPPSPRLQTSLTPRSLLYTRLSIPALIVVPDRGGRNDPCFVVTVVVRTPDDVDEQSWSVGKPLAAFIDLETQLLSHSGRLRKDWRKLIAPLPDSRAWRDYAPSKMDQRKASLEQYLHSVLAAPLQDKTALCSFLMSDIIAEQMAHAGKEGYLTKKGKSFGGWKTRYFVIHGAKMDYYDDVRVSLVPWADRQRGGSHLGSIVVAGAQIGRQNRVIDVADERELRHAFLIIEASTKTRHILCAESDAERDSWIESLVKYVDADPATVFVRQNMSAGNPDAASVRDDSLQRATTAEKAYGHDIAKSSTPSVVASASAPSHSGLLPVPDRERDRKAKSGARFWAFGKLATDKGPAQPVFAVPLLDSIRVAEVDGLPAVVFRCIAYLEARQAALEEGIYRLSGSSAVIRALRERYDAEGDVDLLAVDARWDPHAVAGLLKTYLRELPSSLLTRELHSQFIPVVDIVDSSERVTRLTQLVSQLPVPNRALLRVLTAHLVVIVAHAEVNKMTLRNIGIVFSPTLGIPAGIFSDLINHLDVIFHEASLVAPFAEL